MDEETEAPEAGEGESLELMDCLVQLFFMLDGMIQRGGQTWACRGDARHSGSWSVSVEADICAPVHCSCIHASVAASSFTR